MSWSEHAIFWQVYPLGFLGAEPKAVERVEHRLPRLIGWLDYLVELGANGLLLNPVFAASTHGYDTVDYFRVDPRLGDEADLVALIDAAHERGIKVVLDGVFNHVGRAHPAFADVLAHGPDAATAGWFRIDWPDGWAPGDDVPAWVFEGHPDLISLNHASPAVADLVADVMTYWLERGADGWRLDAAYAVEPAFWRRVLPRVRAKHADAWFVGEVIHGDYPALIAESGLDSLTQYELWQGIWHAIAEANFFELTHALGRHAEFCRSFSPLTFLGNHDVSRIASQVGDPRHLAHALVVLLTVAGTPSIYYGDEQGYTGVKEQRPGGDDQVRPVMPASPEAFSALGAETHELHQRLIALRRRLGLQRADVEVLQTTNTALAYRSEGAEGAVVVGLNLADEPASLDVGGRRLDVPAHGWTIEEG